MANIISVRYVWINKRISWTDCLTFVVLTSVTMNISIFWNGTSQRRKFLYLLTNWLTEEATTKWLYDLESLGINCWVIEQILVMLWNLNCLVPVVHILIKIRPVGIIPFYSLMLSAHLAWRLPSCVVPSGFPIKPLCGTCPTHINLIMFRGE